MSFGWAVIGAGNIARKVIKEITATGRHRLISVYSRTFSRAEELALRYGARAFKTLEEAVLAKGVDGVYIATPHSEHESGVLRCVRLGVPTLCEKPFAANAAQAREAFAAAEAAGVYVSEAMWMRFNPVIKEIIEWNRRGRLGKIEKIKASFCFDSRIAGFTPRLIDPASAGGALLDVGVYTVSYAHMLLGKPDKIECVSKKTKSGVDASDKITLRYKDAVCPLSCAIDRFSTCSARIEGSLAVVTGFPFFYRPTSAALKGRGVRDSARGGAGYINQFDRVAEDIKGGLLQSPEIPHSDTVEVMEILDECRRLAGVKFPFETDKSPF